jgi:Trm5-related predicted tRNA methylase
MFFELCKKGPRIIIDCDFEKLMMEKEVKSFTQQLGYATNANKQLTQPCNLIFTGVQGQI